MVTAASIIGVIRGWRRNPTGSWRGLGIGLGGIPRRVRISGIGREVEDPVRTLIREVRRSGEGGVEEDCPPIIPRIASIGFVGLELDPELELPPPRSPKRFEIRSGWVVVVVDVVFVPKIIPPIASIRLFGVGAAVVEVDKALVEVDKAVVEVDKVVVDVPKRIPPIASNRLVVAVVVVVVVVVVEVVEVVVVGFIKLTMLKNLSSSVGNASAPCRIKR